jgi:hypothetical protein
MRSAISQAVGALTVALAAYLAFLLTQYFLPPHIPRFRIETFFMWFVAVGLLAVLLRAPASQSSHAGEAFQAWQSLALIGIFALAVFVEYRDAAGIGFLSDDFVIADWASRREWIHAAQTGFVRPVIPMTWGLLSFLPFTWSATLHVVNLLLHALNAALLTSIGLKLGFDRATAVAAGLLFVTMSSLTEAVVWISGMQDVLMTTLALGAVLAVLGLRALPQETPLRAGTAVVFTAIALGAKETAIAIPVLAWLAAWATPYGIGRGTRRRTLFTMTTVAILYVAVRVAAGIPSEYSQGIGRYFFKQLTVEPFAGLGAPWSLAWSQAHPWAGLSRIVIVALVAAGFLILRRRDGRVVLALVSAAWVLVAVLPVFSLFHVSATLEGSRYLYLPAAGFALLLALLLGTTARLVNAALTPFVVALGVVILAWPSLAATRVELARWSEAARLRDQILTSYVKVVPPDLCSTFIAEGVVDNTDGAYVLRNGFSQALKEMGAATDPTAGTPCRITWTDHLVVRQ